MSVVSVALNKQISQQGIITDRRIKRSRSITYGIMMDEAVSSSLWLCYIMLLAVTCGVGDAQNTDSKCSRNVKQKQYTQ